MIFCNDTRNNKNLRTLDNAICVSSADRHWHFDKLLNGTGCSPVGESCRSTTLYYSRSKRNQKICSADGRSPPHRRNTCIVLSWKTEFILCHSLAYQPTDRYATQLPSSCLLAQSGILPNRAKAA